MSRRAAALDTRQLLLFEAPAKPPVVAPHVAPVAPAAPITEAVSIPSVLAPAVFRHPQADREIRLHEHVVAYALKRARRRSIGFIVGTEGLSVNAPKWVGLHDIEAALHEKSRWILKKLQEQQERAQRMQSAKVEWRDGTTIPFLGESVIVVLDPRATGAVLNTDAGPGSSAALPGVPRLTLHVGLPHGAAPEQIRDTVQSWLQRQARRVFEERCAHFAQQLKVRVTKLSLSSAQTRWGSASVDGSIRLNWRLIHFAMASIDYVVAHELAHLRHMDHSPRFWDVVRSVLPDYEQARGSLKDGLVPLLD
ncbi:MAG: SprT family zinc-dependent metalloprotease [Variovorax sp.]